MKASREQIVAAVTRLGSLFRRTASDEMIARYVEFWSELDAGALDRAVRAYIQEGKTFPSIAEIRGRAMSERRESNVSRPYCPEDYQPWERHLAPGDPQPHGHFVRDMTLPDGTTLRVMSEDLIGPDGIHRGYPNKQSRAWNAAWAKAHPTGRCSGALSTTTTDTMRSINEPGWNG